MYAISEPCNWPRDCLAVVPACTWVDCFHSRVYSMSCDVYDTVPSKPVLLLMHTLHTIQKHICTTIPLKMVSQPAMFLVMDVGAKFLIQIRENHHFFITVEGRAVNRLALGQCLCQWPSLVPRLSPSRANIDR